MKNVFFALAFMLVGTFAFANSETKIDNQKTEVEITTETQLEILSTTNVMSEDVPCRWRTCRYRIVDGNRELIGCSQWVYGECDRDSDGRLKPRKAEIQAN